MGMTTSQLDYLDQVARSVIDGDDSGFGVLSTGEKLYVAMASNSPYLLSRAGYSIPAALGRLDDDDVRAMVNRWRFV